VEIQSYNIVWYLLVYFLYVNNVCFVEMQQYPIYYCTFRKFNWYSTRYYRYSTRVRQQFVSSF